MCFVSCSGYRGFMAAAAWGDMAGRPEFDVVLHHEGEFLLLLLEGVLEFGLEDVLEFVEGGAQVVVLLDQLVVLLVDIVLPVDVILAVDDI